MADLTGGTTSYPTSLDTAATLVDGAVSGTDVLAAHHNGPNLALIAIETELGVLVKGSAATLVARLAIEHNDDGTQKTLTVGKGGTGLTVGTSGGILAFTGTTTLASSAALTASALILGGGAGAVPTAMGSLGTTTTVLHGNAAGAPTFGAVSLTADVSGILPTANGGTGIAYFTAAGPTVARVYTFPDAAATILTTNAAVTVAQGGTGIASATAYAVLCGGTTATGALQSIASVGTAGQVLTSNGAGLLPTMQAAVGATTLGTEVASTSGTSIDFTGIPAGVKRITIMLVSVSTNGTTDLLIQLGDAGGFEVTGYLGVSGTGAGGTNTAFTAGIGIVTLGSAATVLNGSLTLSLENSTAFTWAAHGVFGQSNTNQFSATSGTKSLSAELTQVRITTVNGTDAFDAGVINISYSS